MRIAKFLLFTGLTIFLILFLGSSNVSSSLISSISGQETFLPPMGKLLSPGSGFWRNAETKKGPSMIKTLKNKHLSASVEIIWDERMVPHIFAQNAEDAFFAQGYVTASLRLWQMEFQTHAAAGRLTEILGTDSQRREVLLGIDRKERLEGLPLAAKKQVELWKKDPEHYAMLEAYSEGINAYIKSLSYATLPVEYKILNYRPEKWSVLKSALLLKRMARTLTSRDHDFQMTNAYHYFGKNKFNQLYPEYFPEQLPVILDSAAYNFEARPVSDSLMLPFKSFQQALKDTSADETPKGIGSNNWAVSGKKTASGHPILCNDPHLALNLPSIWFEVQISAPGFNAYGASLPGAPGVISGFNEHIAWGVTNVSHDVRDWYAIQWKDESKSTYLVDGNSYKTTLIFDTIKVRGATAIIDTLLYTDFGPVARSQDGVDYVLNWTAHRASSEPITFFKLMKGKNYKDYLDAIQHFSCPAQNLVFACKDGDIALWTQGKLPLRRPNQGRFVADGSVGFNQWQGFIPQEHIPHEHNPDKGFVASANQHSVSPDYPYDTYGYFEEYRGRFLNTKLATLVNIELKDMEDLQNSNFSPKAQDFLPIMLKLLNRSALNKEALELLALLKDWDYNYLADSPAPTIFEDWFYNLKLEIYDEIVQANEKGENLRFPEEWQLLHVLKRDTSHFIVDQLQSEEKESIRDIISKSLNSTAVTIPKNSSGKILSWKEMKSTALYHLALIPQFSALDVPVHGSKDALNAIGNRYDFRKSREEGSPQFRRGSTAGPSWKMIVELGEQSIKALAIYPGGQSGNPGSYFYDNMIKDWSQGKYYDVLFLPSANTNSERIKFKQTIKN